ncbi:hypothetical protein [Rheinheimera hassiensis]|uniref:hypothetical protein n=1 Tax=Rheinheimera hassiensis TaxID=1193627 RepID=UPI001F05261E|nr:hypothetical protein [Rheinheimera hassiensis]
MTYAFKITLLLIAAPLIAMLSFAGGQLVAQVFWGVSEPVYWFKLDYVVFASIALGAAALAVNSLDRAIACLQRRISKPII